MIDKIKHEIHISMILTLALLSAEQLCSTRNHILKHTNCHCRLIDYNNNCVLRCKNK